MRAKVPREIGGNHDRRHWHFPPATLSSRPTMANASHAPRLCLVYCVQATRRTRSETMSETTAAPARPTTDDAEAWKTYWQAQGMPWRTEPEIVEERQQYLAERRSL